MDKRLTIKLTEKERKLINRITEDLLNGYEIYLWPIDHEEWDKTLLKLYKKTKK